MNPQEVTVHCSHCSRGEVVGWGYLLDQIQNLR